MIARMKFIKIAAPVSKLETVVDEYVSKYEIQIENTVAEIDKISNLVIHNEPNPYKESLNKANQMTENMKMQGLNFRYGLPDKGEAVNIIENFEKELAELASKRNEILDNFNNRKELLDNIQPYSSIHYDLHKIREFRFIKYRFGRIARDYYKKLNDFAGEDMCSLFCECSSDAEYVWGMYFAPGSEIEHIDAIYSEMNFERIEINGGCGGMIDEEAEKLRNEVIQLENDLKKENDRLEKYIQDNCESLLAARKSIEIACRNYDLRKQLAFSKTGDTEYFILCGWMLQDEADKLEDELSGDKYITVITEEEHRGPFGGAPIKLKNPKMLRPFEMLIKMYGLPDYREFDPTWFVAISYTIIFGMMFGDVGQGLCLAVAGFLVYKFKKMDLAAIIGVAGIFSTIFGFLFGSIFGYEDIIEPLWLRPAESMADLPFVGKMNTVFAYAIALGMLLILVMMVFNIINAVRAKEFREVLFDYNGVCGLIFYGAVVACVVLFMTGHTLPGVAVLVVMFVVPLVLIILKEPLMAVVFKHAESMPKEWGVFAVQVFFEMFEILLSYFSNTLSFVRIGGFAVSHASMMAVVLMLAGAENGGMGNLLVIIIGNILVCGLEGLIVGIQGMRLEYYEMFSRFYRGGGREFKPYNEG